MDKATLTIISSLIGAFSAIIVLSLKSRAERQTEYRNAQREKIDPLLEELGEALYQIVSSVVLLSVNEKDQKYFNKIISKNSSRLRVIRSKVRYQLWGLDEGFKALLLLPSVFKTNERLNHRKLFNNATALRRTLDVSIKNCHLYGRSPNLMERLIVNFWVWRVKRSWSSYKRIALEDEFHEALNRAKKNDKKHKKIEAVVVKVVEDIFWAKDEHGETHEVNRRYRSGRGSRSLLAPEVKVRIYQRRGEEFKRYTFVSPSTLQKNVGESHNKSSQQDASEAGASA